MQMDFNYRDKYGNEMDEDYSTLILDCIRGDQTLYWRKDGVEASWQLLTPVLQRSACSDGNGMREILETYPAGSWGPTAGSELLARDGREWLVS